MLPFFWYMLKVMICSGILFGYYWMFLRNKVFHHYNRFYLLSALLLSLLLPLLKIDFWQQDDQGSRVFRVLQAVSDGDEYMNNIVVTAKAHHWSLQDLYPVAYWLVCGIFFSVLVRTLLLIRSLLKKYPVQTVDEIAFVNTNDHSTPFSFLQFIFWNSNIDINTPTGRQIFKHEVAHIQEKHTYDKLFINSLLVFGWCNPFLWLYRKELNLIHEFIADKKAVEDSDTATFAAMILQAAYPRHKFELTNNFFYSPIKRRLLMLTKDKNPRVNYFARIMALPLAILIFAAFSLKARSKDSDNMPTTFSMASGLAFKPGTSTTALIDSLFETVDAVNSPADTIPAKTLNNILPSSQKPLCIVDGNEADSFALNRLDPGDISTIDVLKNGSAIAQYGDKGKNGVILIKTKKYKQKVETGEAVDPEKALIIYNGIIIGKDGKRRDGQYSQLVAKTLTEKKLNRSEAMAKYGADGINGAIEYSTTDAINITTAYVDAGKMPVFYIGINNLLTVKAQNVKPDELVADISEGKIFGTNGNYIVHVTHEGEVLLSFSKRDGTKLPGSFAVKVKRLPDLTDPVPYTDLDAKLQYDTTPLKKLRLELELLTSQQELVKLDYAERELKVKAADQSLAKTIQEQKLKEQDLQKIVSEQQPELKLQYSERQVPEKANTDAFQKKLADVKVDGQKLQDAEIQNLKLKLIEEQQAKSKQEYESKKLLLAAQADDYQKQLAGIQVEGKPFDLVFTKAEVNPQFPGGEEAWRKYLVKNLKASIPVDEGWKAGKYTVIVKFIVHADGTLSHVSTENYKGTRTALHCIDIIKNGPKWLPAIQNGRNVNAYKKQPITFVIEKQ